MQHQRAECALCICIRQKLQKIISSSFSYFLSIFFLSLSFSFSFSFSIAGDFTVLCTLHCHILCVHLFETKRKSQITIYSAYYSHIRMQPYNLDHYIVYCVTFFFFWCFAYFSCKIIGLSFTHHTLSSSLSYFIHLN